MEVCTTKTYILVRTLLDPTHTYLGVINEPAAGRSLYYFHDLSAVVSEASPEEKDATIQMRDAKLNKYLLDVDEYTTAMHKVRPIY